MDKRKCIQSLAVSFVATFALPAAILLVGCTTDNLTRAKAVYEQIEQQKQAEQDAKAKAEADRIEAEKKAEQDAKDAAEADEKRKEEDHIRKYADGPKTLAQGKKMLWKPAGEHSGLPFLLWGPWYYGKIVNREVLVNGEAFRLTDKPYEGYQEACRLRRPYTGPVTVSLVAYTDLAKASRIRWTWHVPDGSKRYDGSITPTMEAVQ